MTSPKPRNIQERIAELRARTRDSEAQELAELLEAAEHRHQRSMATQTRLEERLIRIENSLLFRTFRAVGAYYCGYRDRLGQALLRSPLHSAYMKLRPPRPAANPYHVWVEQERALLPAARRFTVRPLISVVMATCDSRPEWLREAIASVLDQTYHHWELCICDDASADPAVVSWLTEAAARDERIRMASNPQRSGISAALNRAASLANGDYLAFLDHDDRLSPVALDYVVEALQAGPADLLYSDEDWMTEEGRRERPNFKPGWSPDLLTSCMYMGHLLVARRAAFQFVGGFRGEFDGAQDYDLALRLTEGSAEVRHVPGVLYHWRKHQGSTASQPAAKPEAAAAGKRALADAARRRGWRAEVKPGGEAHSYALRRKPGSEPLVSLVICSRNMKLLGRCLRAVERNTSYRWREVVLVQHLAHGQRGAPPDDCGPLRVVPYTGQFDFATMNNLGVARARGEILVFLNDDVEPLEADWLTAIASQLERPEIGVVGGRLLYPIGNVQHAGIATGMMDGAGHPGRGLFTSDLWRWMNFTRNVTAVTGACLAIRRDLFEQLGGFDPRFPVNYNDLDLCLRARKAGYEVLVDSQVRMRHREGQSRSLGTRLWERERLYEVWGDLAQAPDPFYSPFLDPSQERPDLRFPLAQPDSSEGV
ncbi:MAG: glycosyltransferase [Bryobacteraceae bacterium]